MHTSGLVRVKICCIQDSDEARLAILLGASALGLVSRMPSGPGPIPDELIAEIAAEVPSRVPSVLLTAHRTAADIVEQHGRCRTAAIQMVDRLEGRAPAEVRAALPDVTLFQVIHVTDASSVQEAVDASALVDVILLDSGRPSAIVPELGGTGRIHDWSLSRDIVETVDVPVYLAGGLRTENVAEAIGTVRPYGVDVCSGVRSGGTLDVTRLHSFMDEVRLA